MGGSKYPGFNAQGFRDHGCNFADGKDQEPQDKPLYAKQAQVPRLPVPPLKHTLELLSKSARALESDEEFAETSRKVADFGKPGGLGEQLTARLEKRKQENPDSSWFIKWWNEWAYMQYRDSVVWNVSYYLQFRDESSAAMNLPCRRAARFIRHALDYRTQIAEGTLPPDMKNKDVPMSNTQHKFMFNASRMPGESEDFVRCYAPDLFGHILVARKNRFYTVDVVDASGKYLSVDQITAQLERVRALADSVGTDNLPVGVLTAENRDVWYAKRKQLVQGADSKAERENNQACLERIDSAILCLCLDDISPVTREQVGRALLHSDGRNRWWDKAINLVVFENGKMGYVGEHAYMDGLTTTRMVNESLDKMFRDDQRTVRGSPEKDAHKLASLGQSEPRHLAFSLNEQARRAVAEAGETFDSIIATKELNVLMFHGYGKNGIKKLKVSPDAFAQLAIQYAYYRTFGRFAGTYESTQTRSFLHGRTEVTRSCTVHSRAFAEAMMEGKLPPKQLHALLVAATKAHTEYTALAAAGMGCDRHMLGMKMALAKDESHELFSDTGVTRSATWAISTSGLVGELMDGWGFGEVVPHGIGIGYSVQDDRMRFTVSSRNKGWAPKMCANLEHALTEMQALCQAANEQPKSKL